MISPRDDGKRSGKNQHLGAPIDQLGMHLGEPEVVADLEADGSYGGVDGDGVVDAATGEDAEGFAGRCGGRRGGERDVEEVYLTVKVNDRHPQTTNAPTHLAIRLPHDPLIINHRQRVVHPPVSSLRGQLMNPHKDPHAELPREPSQPIRIRMRRHGLGEVVALLLSRYDEIRGFREEAGLRRTWGQHAG